MLEVWY